VPLCGKKSLAGVGEISVKLKGFTGSDFAAGKAAQTLGVLVRADLQSAGSTR
jgi:hypothetical protein